METGPAGRFDVVYADRRDVVRKVHGRRRSVESDGNMVVGLR